MGTISVLIAILIAFVAGLVASRIGIFKTVVDSVSGFFGKLFGK